MRLSVLSLSGLLVLLYGCHSKPGIPMDYGQRMEVAIDEETGERNGAYILWDSLDRKIEEGRYDQGVLTGERSIYYPDGGVEIREHRIGGVFTGLYQSYYPDGTLEMEGSYTEGAMNGDWKLFYSSGQLKEVVRFVDNNENGPFTEYHPNGSLKAEGGYIDGDNEQGELKLYDESGALERIMDCEYGRCATRWARDESDEG